MELRPAVPADLPARSGNRYAEAQQMRRGGYVVLDSPEPRVVLVANGSEVSLLCSVAERLEAQGIASRVVSMPSPS